MLILAGPITYFQAVVLGLLQGFAELFPISSLGHSVILPRLLGWNIHQDDKLLHRVPGGHAPGHGDRAARLLRARLDPDPERHVAVAGRARGRARQPRGPARLAGRGRHDPRRHPGPAAAGQAAVGVRVGPLGRLLPDPERVHALRRGAACAGALRACPRATPTRTSASSSAPAGVQALGVGAAQAHRAHPGLLALGRLDGGRPAGRASRTRTRPGSPSCWRRRSSVRPRCSRSRCCWAGRKRRARPGRRGVAVRRGHAPTSRCAS